MDDFLNFYEEKVTNNGGKVKIETHDVFARITDDGISTTALGFKGDCVRNKDSKIFEIADTMEEDFTNPTSLTIQFTFPRLFQILGMQIFRKSIHEFFETNVFSEFQRRRDGKITRTDVIQLLVQAKEGQLKLESGDAKELS
jgi:cytochrome P450 family 9